MMLFECVLEDVSIGDITSLLSTLIPFVIGLVYFNRLRSIHLKFFVLYLAYVFLQQLISFVVGTCTDFGTIYWNNTYDVVTYLFFVIWFYSILKNELVKRLVAILFVVLCCISFLTEDYFEEVAVILSYGGLIMILFLVLTFYLQLLQSDGYVKLIGVPEFWIITGLFLFNAAYLPLSLALNFGAVFNDSFINNIFPALSVILYSFYSLALLCTKKE